LTDEQPGVYDEIKQSVALGRKKLRQGKRDRAAGSNAQRGFQEKIRAYGHDQQPGNIVKHSFIIVLIFFHDSLRDCYCSPMIREFDYIIGRCIFTVNSTSDMIYS